MYFGSLFYTFDYSTPEVDLFKTETECFIKQFVIDTLTAVPTLYLLMEDGYYGVLLSCKTSILTVDDNADICA